MNIIQKKVEELIPYINNPRKNDQAVDKVASSIKNFGFKVPIIIDSENEIVTGHTRLKAAQKLGLTDVPCVIADDLSKAQIKAFRIADNKVSEYSEWDEDLLNIEITELEELNFDLEDTGFNDKELDKILNNDEVVEDDFDGEVPENPISKRGDIWLLGRHRVMCGDSTGDDVDTLMDGQKADMVHTDPPYNVNYSNADRPKPSKTDLGKIQNDVMTQENFCEFLKDTAKKINDSTKGEAGLYIWYASNSTIAFYSMFEDTDITINQQVIWKKPMLLGRGSYQWAHEPCIYAKKGKAYFTGDRTKTTVWDFGGYDKSKNIHPTQKPLFIPSEAIQNSSKMDDIVLDLFGGSGSTLIASEQLNRICYMMELDENT